MFVHGISKLIHTLVLKLLTPCCLRVCALEGDARRNRIFILLIMDWDIVTLLLSELRCWGRNICS